jgi:hypothetical protein
MRMIRLENITLYKVTKTILPDGDPSEEYDEGTPYQAIVQYLDDSVAAAIYGANVYKTYRIETLHNELEKLLLPKINNSSDNLSNYLIGYNTGKFTIRRVTPKYIDIGWR